MEHRAREWTVAMGKVRVGRIEKVVLTYIHYHIVRSYWIAQKAQPGPLWWPRGVRCGKGGKYICVCMVCVCGLVTKLCLTLVTPWTVGSSVNGIFQSRILEWVAISFSRGSFQPRDRTRVSCVAGGLLHCRQILYRLSHQGSPCICVCVCVYQFSSVAQLCPTLCDPVNRSMPGFPVHHHLPELAQTRVHQVSVAIQPFHPLSRSEEHTLNSSHNA